MKDIIFLLNLDTSRLTGGARFVLRIADALHKGGYSVAVSSTSPTPLAQITGEPLNCRTLTLDQTANLPPESRILVLPDDLMLRFNTSCKIEGVETDLPEGHFVILSQNRRDIMKSFTDIWPKRMMGVSLANHKNCLGHITVSPYEQDIWKTIYPNLSGWVIPNSIDCDIFKPDTKKKIIAFSEKGEAEKAQIRSALLLARHAKLFKGYAFKLLYGLSQPELAAELAQASVYLQASLYESFGLLAGEAIAAGCIFAGSDGGSDAAIYAPQWAYSCRPTDTLALVQAMQRLDHDLSNNPALIAEKRRLGREFVQTNYTPAAQNRMACMVFNEITQRALGQ